ncbi:MAG TPA: tRNA lysidine(34) synthetase TilS [Clostridiaceae bacterium]|nr:tRNA lysidine(34) synthetase TilS [Clostridiaceae bacterium]
MILPLPRATHRFFSSVTSDLLRENILPVTDYDTTLIGTNSLEDSALENFSTLAAKPILPVGEHTTIIVAVSGGVDSMLLLAYLIYLRKDYSFQLVAAHLHHGLRGLDADRDQEVVATFCRQHNIKLHLRQVDVSALAAMRGKGIEEAGRHARYDFFQDLGTELMEMSKQDFLIALAHHEQDQAETILLNIGRGSGLEGLIGMELLRGRLLRPFLRRSRADIEKAAVAAGIPWQIDHTNEEGDYRRNRLRNELLPLWEEIIGYELAPLLNRLSENLLTEARALDITARQLYRRSLLPDGTLSTKILLTAPASIIARALNIGFAVAFTCCHDDTATIPEGALSQKLQKRLLELCRIDEARLYSLDLPGGIIAEVYANTLRFHCVKNWPLNELGGSGEPI